MVFLPCPPRGAPLEARRAACFIPGDRTAASEKGTKDMSAVAAFLVIGVCAAVFVALSLVRDELNREIRKSRGVRDEDRAHTSDEGGAHVLREEMK